MNTNITNKTLTCVTRAYEFSAILNDGETLEQVITTAALKTAKTYVNAIPANAAKDAPAVAEARKAINEYNTLVSLFKAFKLASSRTAAEFIRCHRYERAVLKAVEQDDDGTTITIYKVITGENTAPIKVENGALFPASLLKDTAAAAIADYRLYIAGIAALRMNPGKDASKETRRAYERLLKVAFDGDESKAVAYAEGKSLESESTQKDALLKCLQAVFPEDCIPVITGKIVKWARERFFNARGAYHNDIADEQAIFTTLYSIAASHVTGTALDYRMKNRK